MVHLETNAGSMNWRVGVGPTLPYQVVLGRDFPDIFKLWDKKGELEGSNKIVIGETEPATDELCTLFPFDDPDLFNMVQSKREQRNSTCVEMVNTGESFRPVVVMVGDDQSHTDESEGELDLLDLGVSSENFGTTQLNEPKLSYARGRVTVINGVQVNSRAHSRILA